MQWRQRKQAKATVAPYYAKAGVAPPRPLPLPREITWPWTNGKPLPMPDCSNRPCGTIGKQIKGATAVEGCRLLPAMPKATAKSCAIAPAAPPGAIAKAKIQSCINGFRGGSSNLLQLPEHRQSSATWGMPVPRPWNAC